MRQVAGLTRPIVGLLAAAALAVSCAPIEQPRALPDATLETIRPSGSWEHGDFQSDVPVSTFVMVIQRLELPVEESVETAWSFVRDDHLSSTLLDAWKTNGMRVGCLAASQVKAFMQSLPATVTARQSAVVARSQLVVLRTSPRLRQAALVDLTIPPRAAKQVVVRRGECQLLSRITSDAAGRTIFDLIPHHHLVRQTLVPRTPQQKALDGRLFDELALRVPVKADELLVIALYRPPPPEPPAPPAPDAEEDSQVQGEAQQPVAAPTGPTPVQNNLGQHLLTGLRANRHLQLVLLVAVVGEHNAAAADAQADPSDQPDDDPN